MLQEKPADNQLVNMTRILLLACFSAGDRLHNDAQQDPQFTQWYMEPAAFNPAVAGNSELTCVSGTYATNGKAWTETRTQACSRPTPLWMP
jgi:hypothetical protein